MVVPTREEVLPVRRLGRKSGVTPRHEILDLTFPIDSIENLGQALDGAGSDRQVTRAHLALTGTFVPFRHGLSPKPGMGVIFAPGETGYESLFLVVCKPIGHTLTSNQERDDDGPCDAFGR